MRLATDIVDFKDIKINAQDGEYSNRVSSTKVLASYWTN